MSDKVIVASVQMEPKFAAVNENLEKVLSWAEEAVRQGAQLIVFPECALTGYCFESRQEAMVVAEPFDGLSVTKLVHWCYKRNRWLVIGTLERNGDRLFNAALLLSPKGVAGIYRKVHLPCLGVDRFVDLGDQPFKVYETEVGRLGIHICYDAVFPESARVMTLGNAEILCLPTNWPEGARTVAELVPRVRALENRVYFIASNRVGEEGGFKFIGMSQIADPSGSWLAVANEPKENLLIAEIDLAEARRKRIVFVPNRYEVDRIGDRRPEFYQAICHQYR
ncbi:MAG: carbon-nitrogen hydrolase family protein [Armatimonadetes bacterium]|nr:carbon-nitrogen hydrolase family protein [Armatimonadota bacterium]MDW8027147.1 carbon-nitrogen hydrolase family protein [Armatimonadota bacterium]